MGVVDMLRMAARNSRNSVDVKKRESNQLKVAAIRLKEEVLRLETTITQLDRESKMHADAIKECERKITTHKHATEENRQHVTVTRTHIVQVKKEIDRFEHSASSCMREAIELDAQFKTLQKQADAATKTGHSVFQF